MRIVATLIAVVLTTGSAWAAAQEDASPFDPRAVVARSFENLYGYSSVQDLDIRSVDGGGRVFTRSARMARRGVTDGSNRMLIRLLGPGELRGVGLLLSERPDLTYDAFLYQPSLRRVRRVSVAQRQDAFFGTDLWFEDLESKRAAQWHATLLREDRVMERPVWMLELRPDGIPSGYERIVASFDRALPVMLRAEFYRGGKRVKELEIDPARIVEKGGHFIPLLTRIQGASGSETVVEIAAVDLRDALPEALFTSASLELGDEDRDARVR